MRRNRSFTTSAVAAAAVLALSPVAGAQRETRERTILASVVDSHDAPVTDLTVKDFIVRENGIAREVTRVAPGQGPTHVAILLDDSQATRDTTTFLRPAVSGFIKQMAAAATPPQMALWTFGERPTRRADFTPNAEAIEKEVTRLFPVTGAGAYLLEAITEATRSLRQRNAERPVIVAFVAENGPEFSNVVERQVNEGLRSINASLWVITLQIGGQPLNTTEARERARVLGDSTSQSGGANDVILNAQALESSFTRLGAALTTRYAVTYGRPESLIPPDTIEVNVRREGLRVRASRWTGQ